MEVFNQQLDNLIKYLDCRLDFYYSAVHANSVQTNLPGTISWYPAITPCDINSCVAETMTLQWFASSHISKSNKIFHSCWMELCKFQKITNSLCYRLCENVDQFQIIFRMIWFIKLIRHTWVRCQNCNDWWWRCILWHLWVAYDWNIPSFDPILNIHIMLCGF